MAIQEAEYGLTEDAMQQNHRYAGDAQLHKRFFTKAKLNSAKSEEAGRPIYDDVCYVEIMSPGNKENIIQRPATEMDKARFAEQYKRYLASEEELIEGTPLTMWPGVTGAQAAELMAVGVKSVEQLAGMSDANCQNVMGIVGLKSRAKQYLEENSAKDKKLEAAEKELADLKARLEALEKGDAPRRGRPPKDKPADE